MADARRSVISMFVARCVAGGCLAAAVVLGACGNDPSQGGGAAVPANANGVSATPSVAEERPASPSTASPAPSSTTREAPADAPAAGNLVRVVIRGEAFDLEPAVNQTTRHRGLGGRASLPERGGMIFAFPFSERLEFVMRDCLIDIDIAYLNNDGRVVSMHEMVVEPREPGESDRAYEQRLMRYPSQFPARFAVEVRGGLLRELGLEVGDVIEFDRRALKARAH